MSNKFLKYLDELEKEVKNISKEYSWSGLLCATSLAKISIIREIKEKYIEITGAPK